MNVNYLVTSAGRSGSIFLTELIKCCGYRTIHTHDLVPLPPHPQSNLIICDRKDLFASIMSMCVAKRTNEYVQYSRKTIEPFEIDCNGPESEFAYQFRWHKWYQQTCLTCKNSTLYKNIEVFYFEDFIHNNQTVLDRLNITLTSSVSNSTKSPHRIKQLIKNYNQCKDMFNLLMETDVFTPLTAYNPLKINHDNKIKENLI